MKRIIAGLVLAAALVPAAAPADQTSSMLNAFTLEQGIDCMTTLSVLHSGGYERNPLAAPFTHSTFGQLGAALAVNLIARKVPVHLLRMVVDVYPVVLLSNVRAMGSEMQTAGMVPRTGAAHSR